MKPIRLIVAAAAFAAVSVTSFAQIENWGPANFKLTSIQTSLYDQTSYTTNKSATSTNITETQSYTTASTNLNNQTLLNMLANSFNTTWPAGATLKTDGQGSFEIFNGNVGVQDVSSVLYLNTSNMTAVYSGAQILKYSLTKNGGSESSSIKYTETAPASIVYDDSSMSTGNGTATRFTMVGTETVHGSMTESTSSESQSYAIDFNGFGSGSYSNALTDTSFVVSGSVAGSASGQ